MKKDIKWGILVTLIGIIGWVIFFSSYKCNTDMCGLYVIIMLFIALFSIIGFWLIGILVGKAISEKKKKWWEYLIIILGIILVILIIT